MSNSNYFTPGPWKTANGLFYIKVVAEGSNRVILSSQNAHGTTVTDKANAALIAAAPEMLEALEGAIDFLNEALHEFNDKSFIEKMRQAVSKARGES